MEAEQVTESKSPFSGGSNELLFILYGLSEGCQKRVKSSDMFVGGTVFEQWAEYHRETSIGYADSTKSMMSDLEESDE